ncbi:hypothetical protein [Flavobacterium sp. T12S277]|uniref:hypothetical protein n=1 Tax=Flavobacterium sp. T12S277 TaxID=3402752 RepID=UPI003AE50D2C
MKVEFRNEHGIKPPGSLVEILSHPLLSNKSIELAVFQEHRYAFFYWSKWKKDLKSETPPCLVSLDWHQDLCFPCETEKEWLENLNLENDGEVAFFSWAKLAGNNDGHILCAAYLNLVGDIYVHCKQGKFESDWEDEKFIDLYGNTHTIKKFKTYAALEDCLLKSTEQSVYFDIDLDFFTLNNPYNNGNFEQKYTYLKQKEIVNMLEIKRPLINWIFERLEGFTIATEPEHCGGLLKSNKLLDIINKIYFEPSLFTPMSCEWKHKSKNSR